LAHDCGGGHQVKKPFWPVILCAALLAGWAFRLGSTAWAKYSQRRVLKVTAPVLVKGDLPGQFHGALGAEEDSQGELVVVGRNQDEVRINRFDVNYSLKHAAVLPAASRVEDLAVMPDGRSLVLLSGGTVLAYAYDLSPLAGLALGGTEIRALESLPGGGLAALDRVGDSLRFYTDGGELVKTIEGVSGGKGRAQRIAATQSGRTAVLIDRKTHYLVKVFDPSFKEENSFVLPGLNPGAHDYLAPAGGEHLVVNRSALIGAMVFDSQNGEVVAEMIDSSLHHSLRHPGFASGSRTAPRVFIHMAVGLLTGTYQ
jgi:hypothetical protein